MRGRVWVLLSAVALLCVAVVVARGGSGIPPGERVGVWPRAEPGEWAPRVERLGDNFLLDLVGGVGTGLLLLMVAVLLVIGVVGLVVTLLGVRPVRRRPAPELVVRRDDAVGGVVARGDVVAAARRARVVLSRRAGGSADAIVRAWVVLEEAFAERGTARGPHQTSTEFVAEVLSAHRVDGGALADLKGLYQRARFGRASAISERDVEAAGAALRRVELSLGGRP